MSALVSIAWLEDVLEARVYIDGRVVHIKPKHAYDWVISEEYEGQDQKSIIARGIARIKECYPDAAVVRYSELDKQYKKDGYRYPGQYDLTTSYLCECGKPLFLEQGSQNAGRNTPWGNPWHTWYECRECGRYYNCMSQEFTDGIYDLWAVRPSKGESGPFTKIPCPKIDRINPYGFDETILITKKVKKEGEAIDDDGRK